MTCLLANSSLVLDLSLLLLMLRLLSGRQQLLDAVLLEPIVKLVKTLLDVNVGLSCELQIEAPREMTLGRDVCKEVGDVGKFWRPLAQEA